MKRAIIVRGVQGVGKSTIIYNVYRWIYATYSPVEIIPTVTWPHGKTTEVRAVLQVGNLIIGISSAGDTGKIVGEYINIFTKHKCDIIIGACRTRGSSYTTIKSRLSFHNGYLVDWLLAEWLSTNISTRVNIGVDILKCRLIGLQK